MRIVVPLLVCLLAGCATAPAGGKYVEVVEATTRIHCQGVDMQGSFGSRLARSAMLRAGGADRSAWTEVEAIALEDSGGEGTCQNVSRLWIRDGDSSGVVFTQRPGWKGRNGNSLVPIDWSPDGGRLLVELQTWTYPTDPVDPLLLVWDASTGQTEQIDVATRLGSRLGADCVFRVWGEGFDREGRIGVRVEPIAEATDPSCVTEPQLWVFGDLALGTPHRIGSPVPSWSSRENPPPRGVPVDGR